MSKYTCPFCFTAVNPAEVWFQCSIPTCSQPNVRRTRFENDIEDNQALPSNVQVKPYTTVFQGTKFQHEGECPQCHRRTGIRVCPTCLSPFPPGIEGLSNTVIAIVGARQTGKSHYIAVLIQLIKQLYKQFGWTLSALNDETMSNYRDKFYEPLYLNNESLKQTQTASNIENAYLKVPLLYSLDFHDRNKTVILAFFDSAGEDLESQDSMKRFNRYIYNASGLILLLDPLLIKNVRKQVQSANLPDERIIFYQEHLIEQIGNLIIAGQHLARGSKAITTPLAIAFSKIDMLKGIFGDDFARFEVPSPHRQRNSKGIFRIDDFQSNSDFIENWIDELAPGLIQGCGSFRHVGYFGVSALGKDPVSCTGNDHGKKKIPGGPIPMHVEAPFLWLLYKNGIIPGK